VAAFLGIPIVDGPASFGREGFPEPEAVLDMGKVWRRADVEEWARSHGRQVENDGPFG
jgi:hypothetical protein